MNVYLTFDVEVWCDGWSDVDRQFPAAFDRYIYGRSASGEFGLPKTIEILNRHGLTGVFFVEPLFAARFGQQWLAEVVALLRAGGQDVQLHLHTEWVNEMHERVIEDQSAKRQHLIHYSLAEQDALISYGLGRLAECGVQASAFRAGSYAANADTLRALAANGICVDTSLNRFYAVSGDGMGYPDGPCRSFEAFGVHEYPVYLFRDGFGRQRPAQLASAGLAEFRQALDRAESAGQEHFVIVSHSFELLKSGSSMPDLIMVRRFEGLCSYLAANRDRFQVGCFAPALSGEVADQAEVGWLSTIRRQMEQAWRRV